MSWGAGLAVLIAPWIAELPSADQPEADPSGPEQSDVGSSSTGERRP